MRLKLDRPIIFFDVETTGVDVNKDRIVELGLIKYNTDGTKESKVVKINPEMDIPKEASDIHGITTEMVKNEHTFKKLAKGIRKYFSGCDLGGFNSNSFDLNILDAEFERSGQPKLDIDINLVDVMLLYRKLYPSSLSGIYKRLFGKELEDAHSAEADITATVDILDHLLENNEEIPCIPKEIDLYLQGNDTERVDFAGVLVKKESVVYFNTGKHKGKSVAWVKENDKSYISWINSTKCSFSNSTIEMILNTK